MWLYLTVTKSKQLYFTRNSSHKEISDGVLAYRFLDKANSNNEQKQLVKVTVSKDYQIMKDQIMKVITEGEVEETSV